MGSSTFKPIELAARRLFNTYFLKERTPAVIGSPDKGLVLGNTPSILFLRQDRIGDVLVSTPIIKAVRDKYPGSRIDMLLSRNNEVVRYAIAPYINTTLIYRKTALSLIDVVRRIRSNKYDVVVDLLDNASSTSSMIVAYSGARYRLGIAKENAGVYSHVVPLISRADHHIVERIGQLLMAFGIEPRTIDLRPIYPLTTEDREAARSSLGIDHAGKRLGVILGGSMEGKRLGREKTIDVLKRLQSSRRDMMYYIFGAPGEERDVEVIAKETGAVAVPPSASFHHFAAALNQMSCLWTPDTSTVHLAAAWNMPCCVMFNTDVEGRMPWYPYHTHCEAVFSESGTIATLSTMDIVQAIERLFAYCDARKD